MKIILKTANIRVKSVVFKVTKINSDTTDVIECTPRNGEWKGVTCKDNR